MEDDRSGVANQVQVICTKTYVAQYVYPEGVMVPIDRVTLPELNPELVSYQPGALAFDLVTLYRVQSSAEDLDIEWSEFQQTRYYWGQQLSVAEVSDMPGFNAFDVGGEADRFVLREDGGIYPICEPDVVLSRPGAFDLPPDMQV